MKIKRREPRLKPEDFPELLELADLVGEFIQYWGFKKVQGRIWACLFLMDRPLNTRQLTQLLKISNSLVSISMTELLKYDVILEAGSGRNGVLLYRANPDAGAVIAGVLRQRERELLNRIHSSAARLPRAGWAPRDAPAHLSAQNAQRLGEWVELARSFLEGGIDFVEASL
jgi:hypothetical protein